MEIACLDRFAHHDGEGGAEIRRCQSETGDLQ